MDALGQIKSKAKQSKVVILTSVPLDVPSIEYIKSFSGLSGNKDTMAEGKGVTYQAEH